MQNRSLSTKSLKLGSSLLKPAMTSRECLDGYEKKNFRNCIKEHESMLNESIAVSEQQKIMQKAILELKQKNK